MTWTRTIRKLAACTVLLMALPGPAAGQVSGVDDAYESWRAIDLAIALDTSDSMEALIDAARLTLWDVVDDLARLEPTPVLRVALLTYGNGGNDARAGWVRVETGLTPDLDLVSGRLSGLTTDGGSEYVGRVMQTALDGLSWTPSEDALKLLFVVGNESADQDPLVSFRDTGDRARREGIVVHPVFCGPPSSSDTETWYELAELAQGRLATIDPRSSVLAETPVDGELAKLSERLSTTFVPLGEEGNRRHENLLRQDETTLSLSSAAAAARARVKASGLYSSDWDLVDALESGAVSLDGIDETELPESLRGMTPADRERYVEEKRLEREDLRRSIAELSERRRRYLAAQEKGGGHEQPLALGNVLRRALDEKLQEQGFRVEER